MFMMYQQMIKHMNDNIMDDNIMNFGMFMMYQQMIKHMNDNIMNRWYVYDVSTNDKTYE